MKNITARTFLSSICAIFLGGAHAAGSSNTYNLDNAEALHRENPRSFSIPRSEQRANLKVGQSAKLIFISATSSGPYSAERMWVEVVTAKKGSYVGKLDNTPTVISGLKIGDEVIFGPEHVIAVILPDEYQLPYGKYALVSDDIAEGNAWPNFVEKLATTDRLDSGWRVSSDVNTDKDLSLIKISVDDLLGKFAVLDSVLDEPDHGLWLWDQQHLEYRRDK